MRLKNARSRAEAHLLVNDHKRFKALSSDEFVTDKILSDKITADIAGSEVYPAGFNMHMIDKDLRIDDPRAAL